MSVLTFAIAATALAASTHALQLPLGTVISAGRGLLDASSDDQGTCNAPADANGDVLGKGCVWLANCEDCGTGSKCVANYELDSLMDEGDSEDSDAEKEHMVCSTLADMVAGPATTTTRRMLDMGGMEVPSCPDDAAIDRVSDDMWSNIASIAEEEGITVTDAATAKTFIADKCTDSDMMGCMSFKMVPMMEVMTSVHCSGMQQEGTICRTDPYAVNSTCMLPLFAGQFGVEEAAVQSLYNTVTELHTTCQALTTEAVCHAYDGTATLTSLNAITAESLTAATPSSQEGLIGYGFAAVMAAVMALV